MLSRRAFGLSAAAIGLTKPPAALAQDAIPDHALFNWGHLYLPYYLAQKTAAASGDAQAVGDLSQQAAMVGDEIAATAQRPRSTPIPEELALTAAPAIATIALHGDGKATLDKIAAVVADLPGSQLIEQRDDYLYAQFTTAVMRFTDDVEFWFDPAAGVIQVRSASRVGHKDFGVNRARIENIRARLSAARP